MAKAAKAAKGEPPAAAVAETLQDAVERRVIRSQYSAIKSLISDRKEELTSVESSKFHSIITEVESLHQLVRKPREQVVDAEALLDIANTLVVSFRSQTSEGVTPSDFVTALLKNFGSRFKMETVCNGPTSIVWADIGIAVLPIFKKAPGCCTMTGPMKTEMRPRTAVVRRSRIRPSKNICPQQLAGEEKQGVSDTDMNMLVMFEILRNKRSVRLESLILNRVSFAQTIENIFALSFLVKDGRVEITMNDSGQHIVSPRNAPPASAISSGEVRYHRFVFRFDYQDWKIMGDSVEAGEELMPHRGSSETATGNSQAQAEPVQGSRQSQNPATPIRKLCKNRGFVVQDNPVGKCSPEEGKAVGSGSDSPQTKKRRFSFD